MKRIKRLSVLLCVLVICFSMMTAPAHAQGLLGGQQFGAWIAAGLVSLNIVANTALQSQPVQALWNWCSAPSAEDRIDYLFPNTGQIISDYMNASTIEVKQGVTTIDGVEYDELLLGPGWSQALKTNLFDFKTKWEILSGQVGTLASGAGYLDGIPVYKVGDNYKTQQYGPVLFKEQFLTDMGNGQIVTFKNSKNNWWTYWYFSNEDSAALNTTLSEGYVSAETTSPNRSFGLKINGSNVNNISTYGNSLWDGTEFQFDYASGIVPTEESEIPEDYGIKVQIPHEKLQTFYEAYPQYNVENTTINITEDNVDIDQLTQAIFDQIENMEDIKAEWSNGEEPEPPVPVDPIENIDENVQSINEYQQNIQNEVSHMHQDVEAMQQTQQQQQQTQQDIKDTAESIDSTMKDVKDAIQPGEITPKKFDLRRLFPFCIPFDIHNMLKKFDAQPQAPHVQLPFVIESIGFSYTFDLDFSAFDGLAAAMRTIELIVYCLGLAWATSKVIKW